MEVENPSLIKALENRYSEDERELAATEAEITKLPPPTTQLATDIDSEVEAALVLFDEIERLAEMPMANEAINAMLERIDLRIGLYFEDAMKGKRPVRKVARGIISLGDFPLPVPPYGEPRVLPTAALDTGLQRRLAAELEAAGQRGAIAPEIESEGCCDDHGHPHHVSEVAARCRDDFPVDPADPPAHGDGRKSRPIGTVPAGIAPSRSQLGVAAAGLEPPTPGLADVPTSRRPLSGSQSAVRFFRILRASGSLISVWRGTASRTPVFGLIQSAWEPPSRLR